MQTEIVTIAANTPTGPYTVTYTICESDTTTGVNVNPSNYHSYANRKRSGSNHCDDDTLGTSSTISFRYYTSSSRKCDRKHTLNGVAVTTTNTNVTPITTGPILVDADGM
jgi:hypothetical protein